MLKEDKKLFQELKNVSERMGNNLDLIQLNGGNTSIKIDDFLYIKGSGMELANANKFNIFAKVYSNAFQKKKGGFKIPFFDKNTVFDGIKPSIELDFHQLMNDKVVLHSHPIDIMARTIFFDEKKLKHLLKDFDWTWIDYYKPGKKLANQIKKSINSKKVSIIILQNHGLIVGGNTPNEAEKIQTELLKKVKLPKREFKFLENKKLKEIKEKFPNIVKIPEYEVIHSIAIDKWSLELSQRNPHCPDHAVFCGVKPPIIDDINDIPKAKNHPYLILRDIGVILLKESKALEIMLRTQAEIFLRVPNKSKLNLLSDEDYLELINWDAEKFRKKMMQ